MSSNQGQYSTGLDKNAANYVPLSPLSFLARSASVYPDHTSAVYEGRRFTWAQTYERCKRFASPGAGGSARAGAICTGLIWASCDIQPMSTPPAAPGRE